MNYIWKLWGNFIVYWYRNPAFSYLKVISGAQFQTMRVSRLASKYVGECETLSSAAFMLVSSPIANCLLWLMPDY